MKTPTYHDVTVIVNGSEYNLFNSPFGYELSCTRVSGWQLWQKFGDGRSRLVGGEYNNDDFEIRVKHMVICKSVKTQDNNHQPET